MKMRTKSQRRIRSGGQHKAAYGAFGERGRPPLGRVGILLVASPGTVTQAHAQGKGALDV